MILSIKKKGLVVGTTTKLMQYYKAKMFSLMIFTKISSLKYALKTLVDVERSFFLFKNMLTDRHHSFMEEKMEYVLWLFILIISIVLKNISTC